MDTNDTKRTKLDARRRELEQLQERHGLSYWIWGGAGILGFILCAYGAVAFMTKSLAELRILTLSLPAPIWILPVGGGLVVGQMVLGRLNSDLQRMSELKEEIAELESDLSSR